MPSTSKPTRDLGLRSRTTPEEVTIEDWPLRNRPVGSLVAIALAAGLAWLAAWATANWAIGALVAGALAATLWRTWLPVRYELSGSGILQTVVGWRRRIPWAAVQQVELRRDGVLFSPDPIVAPLTPLRGLYLHWGVQREAVVAHLEYYVPSAAVPSAAVPSAAVPSAAVPSAAVPSAAVPSAAVPSAAVPSAAVPSAAVPSAAVPSAAARDPAPRQTPPSDSHSV